MPRCHYADRTKSGITFRECTEQAQSRSHGASPQSGLGVGCKLCSSSKKAARADPSVLAVKSVAMQAYGENWPCGIRLVWSHCPLTRVVLGANPGACGRWA